jgi:hypothetical protein
MTWSQMLATVNMRSMIDKKEEMENAVLIMIRLSREFSESQLAIFYFSVHCAAGATNNVLSFPSVALYTVKHRMKMELHIERVLSHQSSK